MSKARSASPIMRMQTGPKTCLCDGETSSFLTDEVRCGNPGVVEGDLSVTVLVVVPEDRQGSLDGDPGCVYRHEDHRLLAMGLRGRVRLAHQDQDLAAWVQRSGRPPLAPVDDVVVTVAFDAGRDIDCVAGCDVRLGHGEAGADAPVQQRFEPLRALSVRAEHVQNFHIPRVGG